MAVPAPRRRFDEGAEVDRLAHRRRLAGFELGGGARLCTSERYNERSSSSPRRPPVTDFVLQLGQVSCKTVRGIMRSCVVLARKCAAQLAPLLRLEVGANLAPASSKPGPDRRARHRRTGPPAAA